MTTGVTDPVSARDSKVLAQLAIGFEMVEARRGEEIEDVELWGWTSYFENVSSFLRELQRNAEIANARYCDYAVERLEICLSSAHLLADHMDSALQRLQGDNLHYITEYKRCVEELITYLQQIANEWQGYVDAFYIGEQNQVACTGYQ